MYLNHSSVAGQLRTAYAIELLPLILLLALPAMVQAQWLYTTNAGAITISGYTGPDVAIGIPSTINGLPVTTIGDGSTLQGLQNVTSVTISNGITQIGMYAFYGCGDLKSILIPTSVTNIGYEAFYGCTNLTSITIPGSPITIYESAFAYCTSLTTVDFPADAPIADCTVFSADTNATAYYLPGTTGWGSTVGGIPAVQFVPPQLSLRITTNGCNVTFSTPTNHLYGLQTTTSLVGGVWSTILSNIPGTGFPTNYIDGAAQVPQKFYRVYVPF